MKTTIGIWSSTMICKAFLNLENKIIMENNEPILPLSPGSSFDEIFKRWALVGYTKFPLATQSSNLEKLTEELDELKRAIVSEHSDAQLLEYIDCILCLMMSLIHAGFNIDQLRQRMAVKVNINYIRQWKYNGNGTYSHIKTPEPEQNNYPNGSTLP